MSYNGSGTFQINTSGQPVVTGTSISSTVFNALTADLATGLSTAITKDGQTTTTARIPFALGINSTLVTDATNTTSGSIITAGGVGIAKALFVGTTANVAGAVTLGGVATFSAQPIFSSLTASSAVATDASKGLVSVTNTGTGNNVLATTPTIATPSISSPTISDGTANGVAYLNGSKVLTTGSALVFDGTNLGVGTTPSTPLHIQAATTGGFAIRIKGRSSDGYGDISFYNNANTVSYAFYGANNAAAYLGSAAAIPLTFYTNNAEVGRFDSSGNLLVGGTSASQHYIYKNAAPANRIITFLGENGGAYISVAFKTASSQAWNAANTVQEIGSYVITGRSINAAGTINASGADYAEYMTKADNFSVAKGDVVGIDAQGKLTNVFANAMSFVVKSTNPSYVGGDSWGVGFEDDAVGLEAARQLVDRIAFAGQVPVNVTGATAGQYIIPANDNGAIKGEAVSNPTFEQYQVAVGKVIAIESDGRAKIIVKVA